MHVHRPYPFHPTYWATECFFWPGFVPWKMFGELQGPPPPEFPCVDFPWQGVSDPGEVVPDATQIIYRFPISGSGCADELKLSLEQISKDGKLWARWKIITNLAGILTASAWLYQPNPQRNVATGAQFFNVLDQVDPTSHLVPMAFHPSTFADGGSPFPNY